VFVVSALCKDSPCLSSFRQILEDTRIRLHDIPCFKVQHIRTTANQATHTLAKAALRALTPDDLNFNLFYITKTHFLLV
jgi:hypothetical protein